MLVDAFNQEKALVGAFSVIVELHRLIIFSTTSDTCLKYFYGVGAQPSSGHRSRDTGSEAAPGQHLLPFSACGTKKIVKWGVFSRSGHKVSTLRTVTGPMFIDGAEAR